MKSVALQIRENNIKVIIAMTALTLIVTVLGTALSTYVGFGLTGTSWFLILAGILNFLAYFFSDRIILRATAATPLSRAQAPELYQIVDRLCAKEGLPVPKLYLMDETTMNAYATGRNQKKAAVAVTRGLVERLTPEEVEGVIAHELSHIQNFDMRMMAMVSVLVGGITLLADIFWASSVVGKAQEKDQSGIVGFISIALALFAPITGMFLQLFISRRREYVADACAAAITKQPKALSSALRKISRDVRLPRHWSAATASLYFSFPSHDMTFLDRLFSTHPPIEERIRILESM